MLIQNQERALLRLNKEKKFYEQEIENLDKKYDTLLLQKADSYELRNIEELKKETISALRSVEIAIKNIVK